MEIIVFLAFVAAIVFWPFTLIGIGLYGIPVGAYYLIKAAVRNGVKAA